MARGLVFVFGVAVITLALIVGYAFWRPATERLKQPSMSPSAAAASAARSSSVTASPSASSSATPTASATATPKGQYANEKYGYTLVLPEPYRYSEVLSSEMPQSEPVAQQAFTARTKADEDRLKDQRCETACPVWNYVAVVMTWTNTGSLSPREWYEKFSYSRDQMFSDLVIDGRAAVRVDHAPTYPVEIIVKDGARMIVIAYQIYIPYTSDFDPPAGASHDKLEQILASFHFIS